jgi:hypothetical protein
LKNQQAINQLIQKQKMEASMTYSNQKNARQPTGSSKDKNSHYQTEAGQGYAVT